MDYKPRNAFRESYEDAKRYKREKQKVRFFKAIRFFLKSGVLILAITFIPNVMSDLIQSTISLGIFSPSLYKGDYLYIFLPVGVILVAAAIGVFSGRYNRLIASGVSSERFQNLNHRLESLQKTVELYREALRTLDKNATNVLDDEGKKELYETIYAKIKGEASDDFLRDIENNVRANTTLSDVRGYFSEMEDRLLQRAGSLNTTSFINLFIGITIAIIGISILLYFVFNTDYIHAQKSVLLIEMLAKLGVSIGVEFLSFFFLNLYRKNLQEIKYIQNEITNIEAKKVALMMAYELPVKLKFKIINSLSLTERNFVLDKGQTTVELETLKHEQKDYYKMIKHSGALVRAVKDK